LLNLRRLLPLSPTATVVGAIAAAFAATAICAAIVLPAAVALAILGIRRRGQGGGCQSDGKGDQCARIPELFPGHGRLSTSRAAPSAATMKRAIRLPRCPISEPRGRHSFIFRMTFLKG
jgi:hypothetical protein